MLSDPNRAETRAPEAGAATAASDGATEAGRAPRGVLLSSRVNFDAPLHLPVLRALHERFGTKIVVMVGREGTGQRWRHWLGDAVEILDFSQAHRIHRPPPAEIFETARRNEERFGLSYMRDILHQDKAIAAHYLQHAPHSPQAKARPRAFEALVDEINQLFEMIAAVMDRNEVDLCLTRASGVANSVALAIAQARGAATSWVNHLREGNRMLWMEGAYHAHDLVAAEMRALADAGASEDAAAAAETLDAPPDTKDARKSAQRYGSVARLARETLRITKGRMIDRTIDLLRRSWPDRQTWATQMGAAWNEWRCARQLTRFARTQGARERPYVLFLLHLDPEYTSSTLSRPFNHVHAVLQQLSLSIPVGWDLVVKEHVIGIGNRSGRFYEELSHLPNLRFADFRAEATTLAAEAELVATVWGTICIEAGFLGKPVLSFARFNEFEALPHVFPVREIADLPARVRAATASRSAAELDAWRAAARRFRRAQRNLSFALSSLELNAYGNVNRFDEAPPPAAECDRAVDALLTVYRQTATAGGGPR